MKKIPLRMCNGCGEMKPKKELIRVVRTPSEEVLVDKSGRAQGRGAYICPRVECIKKARKTKRLDKVLSVSIPDEIYDSLEKEFEEVES